MDVKDPFQDWKETVTERRRSERYPPASGATAVIEGRSYRMMDISRKGLSVYDYGEESVPEETVISLYSIEEGFIIDALKCRKVSDNRVVTNSPYGQAVINRIGLEIMESDPDLEHKLLPFMGEPEF